MASLYTRDEYMDFVAHCQYWLPEDQDEIIAKLDEFYKSGVCVDDNYGSGAGGSGIYIAMALGLTKVVRWFIEHGADMNQQAGFDQHMMYKCLLSCAIEEGMDAEIIRKMLEAGADPNAPEDEVHPLEIAKAKRNAADRDKICALLTEFGARAVTAN